MIWLDIHRSQITCSRVVVKYNLTEYKFIQNFFTRPSYQWKTTSSKFSCHYY
jgi:hypothetical protein